MSAYLIVRVTVRDQVAYREYMQHTPRVIDQFGGRMLVRGGATETLEGREETQRIVIIEFPSMEQAKAFYASPEYQKAKALREGAGEGQFILVEGYPESQWREVVEESGRRSFDG